MLKTREVMRSGVLRGYGRTHLQPSIGNEREKHTGCTLGLDRGGHAKSQQTELDVADRLLFPH